MDALAGQIAACLQQTGVLGEDIAGYLGSVAARIDYLASCGAGFHNDVSRHWSRCLFWLLTLPLRLLPAAWVPLSLNFFPPPRRR